MSHHYAKIPTSDRDQGTGHPQSHHLSRARSERSSVRLPSLSDGHDNVNSVLTLPVPFSQGGNCSGNSSHDNDNENENEDDDDLDVQALSFGEHDEFSQQQQLLRQELQEGPQTQHSHQSAPASHTKIHRALDPYLSLFSSPWSTSSSNSPATSSGGPSSSATTPRRLPLSSTADGVFANISAKPEVESQKNSEVQPPAYDSAIQDVTPPYFEMTVVSPRAFGDDVLVDGLPVGNFFQFLWNVAVAVSFQFLGALLTYLLHNSHASKSGSMVGLGLTLLNFGIRMRGGIDFASLNSQDTGEITQVDGPPFVDDTGYISGGSMDPPPPTYGSEADSAQMDWLQTEAESQWVSLLLMIVGWMIIIKALAAYVVAKKTEKIISAQPSGERDFSRASIDSTSSDHYV
ncbi:unnamed protein product [Mortierella alpina]